MRLTRDSLGKQCLTGSGRAHQQSSLGELGADLDIFPRIVQEIYHFLQRFLGFILSGHIRECYAGVLLHILLGCTLAHASHESAAAGSSENEPHDDPQKSNGQHIGKQERYHHSRAVRYVPVDRDACLKKPLRQRRVLLGDACVADRVGVLKFDLQTVRTDIDLLYLVVIYKLHELVVTDPRRSLGAHIHHITDHYQGDHRSQKHDHQILTVGSLPAAAAVVVPVAVTVAVSSVILAPLVVVTFEIVSLFLLIIKKIS